MGERHCIGDYINDIEAENKYLLEIKVHANDIMKYWSKCGLIANFGSSYFSITYPNNKNISNSISFILNELLENAIKYSCDLDIVVKVVLAMEQPFVILNVKNIIDKKQYGIVSAIISDLQDFDSVNKKYMERLESVSKDPKNSGMGLLSIMKFFKGRLSVRFLEQPMEDKYEACIQVKMNVEDL